MLIFTNFRLRENRNMIAPRRSRKPHGFISSEELVLKKQNAVASKRWSDAARTVRSIQGMITNKTERQNDAKIYIVLSQNPFLFRF